MSDVVVTLPRSFTWSGHRPGIQSWMAEGGLPGQAVSTEYGFSLGGPPPKISPGERVYVWYADRLIGFAPLVRVQLLVGRRFELVRAGGAQAVTIPERRPGFRGFRYRWWDRSLERPIDLFREFPDLQILPFTPAAV